MSVPTQVPSELPNELPTQLPARVAAAVPAPRGERMSIRLRDRILSIASPLGLLIVWELAARFGFIDTRFFPAPSSIFALLIEMLKSGELMTHTLTSLQRLFWGTLIGGIPALVLGVVMGLNRVVRAVCDPLIAATYPIPKSSILPLALLIFGLGEPSKIFMVAIGVFFPVAINATTGVLEINKIYLDVGRNYKASRWNMFWTIALPGALPVIMTGFKLGIGIGLILIAVAEMIGAKSGLGYLIWSAWETFAVEQMYVGLFMIALIGFVLTLLLNELERFIIPWKVT
jgi:ABC-type nitrate/sulfonate/bicarbonate transport system permease component